MTADEAARGAFAFRWRDAWWRVAVEANDARPAMPRLARLAGDAGPEASFPLRGYGSPYDSTSWMPVVDGDRLRFVYSLGPSIIVDASAGDGTIAVERAIDPGVAIDHWRGGAALLPCESGWLAIAHEDVDGRRAHRFVAFDADVLPVAASEPFAFRDAASDIVAGFEADADGARLLVRLSGAPGVVVSIARAEAAAMLHPLRPARRLAGDEGAHVVSRTPRSSRDAPPAHRGR